MIKDYETILEDVLEAKDKGISLSTLLLNHPLQKGEYSDAWKFVEGINDYISTDAYPDKKRFKALIDSIPHPKPVISQFMPYIAFATPVLIVLFVVFSYSSPSTPESSPVALVTENISPAPEVFDASQMTETIPAENPSLMAMSAKSVTTNESPLESSIASFELAYTEDFSSEKESSINFTSASDYNNLSSLYE